MEEAVPLYIFFAPIVFPVAEKERRLLRKQEAAYSSIPH